LVKGQQENNDSSCSKFSLGFDLGLFRNQASPDLDNSSPDIEHSVIGHWDYGGNVSLEYSFTRHWKILACPGIEIKKLELQLNVDKLDFGDEFDGLGFNGYSGTDPHIISYNEQASFFTLPVLIKYDFNAGRFSPIISAGGSVDFLLSKNEHTTAYYNNGTQESWSEQDLFRSTDAALLFQAGMRYRASKKISISLNCLFKYFLLDKDLIVRQFYFGLAGGVQYCFK